MPIVITLPKTDILVRSKGIKDLQVTADGKSDSILDVNIGHLFVMRIHDGAALDQYLRRRRAAEGVPVSGRTELDRSKPSQIGTTLTQIKQWQSQRRRKRKKKAPKTGGERGGVTTSGRP